jgi:hypothetical protein
MQTSIVEVSIAKLESSMMKMLKSLISSRYLKMLVFTRKLVGALGHNSNYVDDISVIGNYVFFLIC